MYLKSSKVVTILNRIIMTSFLHSLQPIEGPRKARFVGRGGCSSRTSVLQEIINIFGFSVPEASTAFGTFFELMCSPRGIAAAVAAKNMPPACFLNAPTVLQEIICFSSRTTKPRNH